MNLKVSRDAVCLEILI